ncbi:hypothetical protein ACMFMG_003968 [Clarireedia jacksonii]
MAFIVSKARALLNGDERAEQDRAWIHFSKNWASLAIGKDWVGRRYLGGGTYGIAALFEYVGDNENVHPRQIVVKQEAGPSEALKQESRMLSRLMKYKSEHIIQIYRAYHRTFGQGTSSSDRRPSLDPESDVSRIYLEYAANGDLSHYLRQSIGLQDEYPNGAYLPEEAIWRIWECLVKALLILEKGTEDPNWRREKGSNEDFHHPICHFDIKGANGHERINVHKLADFGLALPAPLTVAERRGREWIRVAQGRNSWHSPEQRYPNHPNRIISPRSDIWNTAHLIYKAMCNNTDPGTVTFTVNLRECGRRIKTMGRKMLVRRIYSRTLRENVLECLAFDPEDRPPAAILLRRIQAALRNYGDPANRHNPPEWPSPEGPDLRGEDGMDDGKGSIGDLEHPTWMYDVEEDEDDYEGIQLLYPTRSDLMYGIREMPFETENVQRPRPQNFRDFRESFFNPGMGERNRRSQANVYDSSLDVEASISRSTSKHDSDEENIKPESPRRHAYEARIESIRPRPRLPGRYNRGGRAMKGAGRQPGLGGSGLGGVKQADQGVQPGRVNRPAAPPPGRRSAAEIAQDSVFDRARARNMASGRGRGPSANRARDSGARRPFGQDEDSLRDYEYYYPPTKKPPRE